MGIEPIWQGRHICLLLAYYFLCVFITVYTIFQRHFLIGLLDCILFELLSQVFEQKGLFSTRYGKARYVIAAAAAAAAVDMFESAANDGLQPPAPKHDAVFVDDIDMDSSELIELEPAVPLTSAPGPSTSRIPDFSLLNHTENEQLFQAQSRRSDEVQWAKCDPACDADRDLKEFWSRVREKINSLDPVICSSNSFLLSTNHVFSHILHIASTASAGVELVAKGLVE
ncbi:unnamed protein product [Gongylonema pulchrum]|uniref:Transmembrane protein n=1 Tax=Gongylonema pulchrum TaxID=637853 RepID=A0A183E7L0_9BILA|nr:unnamed protein product [Gongylonema pulchrum]